MGPSTCEELLIYEIKHMSVHEKLRKIRIPYSHKWLWNLETAQNTSYLNII